MATTMNRLTHKARSRYSVQTLALDTAVMDQFERSLFDSISVRSFGINVYLSRTNYMSARHFVNFFVEHRQLRGCV